jgi:hypothetical protein
MIHPNTDVRWVNDIVGYGFEIAVRDIAKDEQITDDYGLFNLPTPMDINCGEQGCRGRVTGSDLDTYWQAWDLIVRPAVGKYHDVPQPLARYLDESTKSQLRRYAEGAEDYVSVFNLRNPSG